MYKNLLCYDVVYHIIEYVKGKVVELKKYNFFKKTLIIYSIISIKFPKMKYNLLVILAI